MYREGVKYGGGGSQVWRASQEGQEQLRKANLNCVFGKHTLVFIDPKTREGAAPPPLPLMM